MNERTLTDEHWAVLDALVVRERWEKATAEDARRRQRIDRETRMRWHLRHFWRKCERTDDVHYLDEIERIRWEGPWDCYKYRGKRAAPVGEPEGGQ